MQLLRILLVGGAVYLAFQEVMLALRSSIMRVERAWVAGWLLTVAALLVARIVSTTTEAPALAVLASRVHVSALLALGPQALLFTRLFPGAKTNDLAFRVGLAGAIGLVALPWLGDLVLTDEVLVVRGAFGGSRMAAGRGEAAWLLIVAIVWILAFMFALLQRVEEDERRGLIAKASLLVLIPAALNDALSFLQVLPTPRVIELALAVQALVVAYGAARRTDLDIESLDNEVRERNVELEQQQRENATALNNLLNLVEALPDAVFVVQQGRIRMVNRAAMAFLNRSEDELVGQELGLLGSDDKERRRIRDFVEQIHASPAPPPAIEVEMTQSGGEWAIGEMRGLALEYDGATSAVLLVHDLSERESMQRQLIAADRLASVGTMAAGVAHEINNPLTFLMANLDECRHRLQSPVTEGDRRELDVLLAEAHEGSDRIRRIVRDLKVFSRSDEQKDRSADVEQALRSALKFANNQLRHAAEVELEIEPLPSVAADESKLVQVFVNLLVNAAHAIEEESRDQRIVVRAYTEDKNAVIEIRDSGAGMPPEVLSRIFDPFFTTKPVGVGTGLGLSICHAIISAIGGSIHFRSDVGKGTVARVVLPPATIPARRSVMPSAPGISERAARVLIVDDEPALARAVKRMLKGCEVSLAGDGAEALKLCASTTFDVILCDVMMPRMSGVQVYEHLAEAGEAIERRVIFMTGGAFTQAASDFLSRVPNQVLLKPLDRAALLTALTQVLEETADGRPSHPEPPQGWPAAGNMESA